MNAPESKLWRYIRIKYPDKARDILKNINNAGYTFNIEGKKYRFKKMR